MPPCAATVCDRVGNTLVTHAVFRPASAQPSVARRPAPPAPIRRVNLPVDELMQAIAATGLFVRRSVDAGDYLCNAILYASLQWCAENRGTMAGFIHVPMDSAERLRPAYEAAVAAMITRLSRNAASYG